MLLCIIFALSKVEWRKTSRDLAVFYLVDRSESIPSNLQTSQVELIETLSEKATTKDQSGVIVFGQRPSMETSPVPGFDFEGVLRSTVPEERTDIAAAMRLALATFPADRMRRMVLLSDGNENLGSSIEVARIAANNGIPVDVIPLNYDSRNDVRLEKVVVPQRTSKEAPFDLKVYLESEQEAQGLLRIYEDDQLIVEDTVRVSPGRNPPLVISRRLEEGGFHNYSATIEVQGDSRPQNNSSKAFTYLKSEPKVLIVDGSQDPTRDARYLLGALQAESIDAEFMLPTQMPTTFEDLQRYDTLILSNVAASNMSVAQMQMIERSVHDLGVGLVMIGGVNSFGAGGYIDTPIEKALPVSMDIKQKKLLPNGALVVTLHTAEMGRGNDWAREISLASLNVLSAQDYFGLNYIGNNPAGGGWGETWLWSPGLQKVGDKRAMRTAIKGVQPMDAQAFDGLLRMAADELIKVNAQTKHIVVISDGDPAPPTQSTVNKITGAGITVSGVAVSPHDPRTVQSLKDMAFWGKGNYYYPQTNSELPRIFTKEATIVRKSLIREETFTPRRGAPSETILGMSGFPPLDGYVITTTKDLAIEALSTEFEDPLLVHWRYGLGKSVAFTSDAKDKWATNWVASQTFAKFWAQVIRWSLRETNNPNFDITTQIDGGKGKIVVDAVDEEGNFQNFIDFETTVIGPDFEPQKVTVSQVAPGRYEGEFPADEVGTYMVSMVTEEEEGTTPQFLTSGVSLSYSPEYETSRSAPEFLQKISEATNGKFIEEDIESYNPYTRDLVPAQRPIPLWPWLLLLGTVLLPVDIFFRRVYLSAADVALWIKEKFSIRRKAKDAEAQQGRLAGLKEAKSRALKDRDEEKKEKEARKEFRERLAQKSQDGKSTGSVFEERKDAAPAVRDRKQTVTADDGNKSNKPQQGGMSALMEAKKRAQQRRKK